MNECEKVYIKGKDFDSLYEAFENVIPAYTYTPTIDELKIMVKDLKKYAVFLMWIEDTGETTADNEEVHSIISAIIKKYIVIINDDKKKDTV